MNKFWKIAGQALGFAVLGLVIMVLWFFGTLLWQGIHWAVSL